MRAYSRSLFRLPKSVRPLPLRRSLPSHQCHRQEKTPHGEEDDIYNATPIAPRFPFTDDSTEESSFMSIRHDSSLHLPVELPSSYYAGIINTPDFPYYIDYPSRNFHLKYHSSDTPKDPQQTWGSLHFHQVVSQPRMHAK